MSPSHFLRPFPYKKSVFVSSPYNFQISQFTINSMYSSAESNRNSPDVDRNVLVLGMVYSSDDQPIQSAKYGQLYRDKIRCDELCRRGFNVFSLDEKHSPWWSSDGKHCQTNFCYAKQMIHDMQAQWGRIKFKFIMLDYFLSPVRETLIDLITRIF